MGISTVRLRPRAMHLRINVKEYELMQDVRISQDVREISQGIRNNVVVRCEG
jgi:hypothetical protein